MPCRFKKNDDLSKMITPFLIGLAIYIPSQYIAFYGRGLSHTPEENSEHSIKLEKGAHNPSKPIQAYLEGKLSQFYRKFYENPKKYKEILNSYIKIKRKISRK